MNLYIRDNWPLFVGLGLSSFSVFIALLGIGLGMTLTFLALAVLTTVYRGGPSFPLLKTSPLLAVRRGMFLRFSLR